MSEPVPNPASEAWVDVAAQEESHVFTVQIPAGVELVGTPAATHEGSAFTTPPAFKMLDAQVHSHMFYTEMFYSHFLMMANKWLVSFYKFKNRTRFGKEKWSSWKITVFHITIEMSTKI